jgi:hypothetical protein
VGWGLVYVGYLLVGKLVGERAPTKFIALGGLKSIGIWCRGGFADIIDNHRQIIKTRPDAVPNRGYSWGGGWFM